MIKTISRRTVLRGTGAAIALPMLEIMTPRLRATESSSDKVARMVCIYTPHGAVSYTHLTLPTKRIV